MNVIVGDRMQAFAATTEAMTLTEFLELPRPTSKTVVIGQGLNLEQMDCLKQHCAQHNLELLPAVDPVNRAGRSVTHKRKHQNGLISVPVFITDNTFEAELLVDDQGELLLDHATGCHIQGMVLIEAIRQMFIAVAETGYQTQGVPQNGYVVFNSIDVRFKSFAFPTSAILRHTTDSFHMKRPDRATFKALIEVIQNGVCVAAVNVSYTVFESTTLAPKETQKAQEALAKFKTNLQDQIWQDSLVGQSHPRTLLQRGQIAAKGSAT
ncbi:AfsA-related hotdog domain-containing protein [Sedimenticola selenatireducens]|uniref:A-factor biosynthesis hotdog domain-containing protein n=1 Tax=Sedimenticola selenatireducens TaxID=191960 RepID=A0A2N6CV38_9GAMM|nr:AfsA-related hotdog domain-containing protein [Sedimenticola selenatireducens]PLX61070.1 MAG: hypothetical protein C0630_11695 [Sedimenticola selenatireducens]